jgi:hypothetical protein
MAPVNPPSWQQTGSYPARLDRLTIAGLLTPAASVGPIAARSGVRPAATGAAMGVIQRSPADMLVTVNPGTVFIAAVSPVGGVYVCHNDDIFDVTIAAADPTLPRKDLVIARVYDAVDDVGSRNEWAIEPVKGTANAVPVAPAAPAGAVVLAQITVPAGVTSIVTANITDVRPYTVALGGVLPVSGQTQRDAIAASVGLKVYRLDTGATETYNGSTWDAGTAYTSEYISGPTYSTDSTFNEYTAAQWPSIDVPCPASGTFAVSLRAEAYNSSTVNSSFRFGAVVKDMTAGGGAVINPSTLRGPCLIRGIAQSTSPIQGVDRYLIGGAGELAGLAGHTLRFVPAWYISSHQFAAQAVTNGRMTVEPLAAKYVAL